MIYLNPEFLNQSSGIGDSNGRNPARLRAARRQSRYKGSFIYEKYCNDIRYVGLC